VHKYDKITVCSIIICEYDDGKVLDFYECEYVSE
jgi:hypothetical protein